LLLLSASSRGAEPVDYVGDIKPLLAAKCYECHSGLRPAKAKLRLDTGALIRKGGKHGPVVRVGNSAASPIIERVTTDDETARMPPEGKGELLTSKQVALLRAWIDQGAKSPPDEQPEDPTKHWAYQPPVRPAVPAVHDPAWVRNPIDAFLAVEHHKRGLHPLPPAPKEQLLRRLHLDLTGLPPTCAELHAFQRDPSPDAYEKVVDRLLSSPRYGERWGRHWMDVWRYSDWYGKIASMNQYRHSQRHIWRWRDWIIESINRDKGYDRMIVEMLAGDELAPGDDDLARATGFLGRNYFVFNRNVWLQDAVEYTTMGLLGITLKCCRCHDHKYDPFTQKDYYRFRAFFEPYDVRTDRIPGKPEMIADYKPTKPGALMPREGFDRVYDAHLTTPTYVFQRGNEMHPLKNQPMKPDVPEFLKRAELGIRPIALPLDIYYPNLRPFVLADARQAAEKAQTALAAATFRLAVAECGWWLGGTGLPPSVLNQRARAELALHEKALATAQAEQVSLAARFAAEKVKYTLPGDSSYPELARAAAAAERMVGLHKAEEGLARAERQAAEARQALDKKPGNAELKKAVDAAQRGVAMAKKALEAAGTALANPGSKYQPLGAVYPSTSTGRRLALARWIADKRNPLTARVAVNHIWLRHIGSALVPTVANFGLNSKPPSHPALLDWLAVEFMDKNWSMKALHRLIVTSNAYRMQSAPAGPDDPKRLVDGQNRYLWRMNEHRMESEVVRDSILHLTGGLDLTMGGPDLDPETAESCRRRSLYFKHTPEDSPLFLDLFDRADPVECYRRVESIVPQQPLALMNSGLSVASARLLARTLTRRLGGAAPETDAAFVTAAFEHLLARPPSAEEQSKCATFLRRQAALFGDPTRLKPLPGAAPVEPPPAAEPHLRARENLIHVLFNYNEFVTIR
jgi:hypothetical protein